MNEGSMFEKEITNIISKNKFSQAYILVCTDEKVLKEAALKLSKVLICPSVYSENCTKCNICRRIDNNNYSELKIINPENNIIKKEQIISVRNTFQTASIESKNQVYIINNSELLNSASANSILKFLEEPDSNTVAVFTTGNLDKMLLTIVSRCKVIRLENNNDSDELEELLKYCEISKDLIPEMINVYNKIECGDIILSNLNDPMMKKYTEKNEFKKLLKFGLFFYKDLLKISYGQKPLILGENLQNGNNKEKILKKINIVLENIEKIEYNVNMNLFIINYFIRIGEVSYD